LQTQYLHEVLPKQREDDDHEQGQKQFAGQYFAAALFRHPLQDRQEEGIFPNGSMIRKRVAVIEKMSIVKAS